MKISNYFLRTGLRISLSILTVFVAGILFLALTSGREAVDETAVPAPRHAVITAAGATFPLPFYTELFKIWWEKNNIPVTYAGIGTDRGITSLRREEIDFAGIDIPLTTAELAAMPGPTVMIPTCLGAVAIGYNLEGTDNLRLTGELLADIFLGRIVKWNDSQIAAVNPGRTLPDKEIYPVFRLDGSGTTYIFSDYLSKISPDWKTALGTGKQLNFPRGVAASGNSGVAGLIERIPGAIGYVSTEYANIFRIQQVSIRNRNGQFVQPSTESITAATESLTATNVLITDSPAQGAYPISCLSWILLYKDQAYNGRTQDQARETLRLLEWLVSPETQAKAPVLRYAPLSTGAAVYATETLKTITYEGKKLLR